MARPFSSEERSREHAEKYAPKDQPRRGDCYWFIPERGLSGGLRPHCTHRAPWRETETPLEPHAYEAVENDPFPRADQAVQANLKVAARR